MCDVKRKLGHYWYIVWEKINKLDIKHAIYYYKTHILDTEHGYIPAL